MSRLVERHYREPSAERNRPPTGTSATRFQQCWIARLGHDRLSRGEKSLDVGAQGAALLADAMKESMEDRIVEKGRGQSVN